MASIIIMTGEQKGDYYPLGHRTTVIGRDEGLLVQILGQGISRKHLRIRFDEDDGKYYAADMKSKNGVLINGVKISDETELKDGDYITIGKATLWFTLKDFPDRENALNHFKKFGQRANVTEKIDE